MRIFEKPENTYYEFVSYLMHLAQSGSSPLSIREVKRQFSTYFPFKSTEDENADLKSIENTIRLEEFRAEEEEQIKRERDKNPNYEKNHERVILFTGTADNLEPIVPGRFPIRFNLLEKQALKSILNEPTLPLFMEEGFIERLRETVHDVPVEWELSDIQIRNRQEEEYTPDKGKTWENSDSLKVIIEAIRWGNAILCDNIGTQWGDFKGSKVFPVKVEYSIYNNQFRVWAYEPEKDWFFKMNLSSLYNVQMIQEYPEKDLQDEFKQYLRKNSASVRLHIDSAPHHIDRCFRIFSYYDREAEYDEETGEYILTVTYQRTDRMELIKNILQMGPHAVVLETIGDTEDIRKAVYKRIKAAKARYQASVD